MSSLAPLTIDKKIADLSTLFIEENPLKYPESKATKKSKQFNTRSFTFLFTEPIYGNAEISEALKAEDYNDLEELYYFERPNKIWEFFNIHKELDLVNLLLDMYKHITALFGYEAKLCVDIYKDPEEDFEGLFVTIRTHLPLEKAFDLLQKFDDEWWLDVDSEIRTIVGVDIEPVS